MAGSVIHEDLILKARKLRQDTFNAFVECGEAHLGGSFSIIEMLIALYSIIYCKNFRGIIKILAIIFFAFRLSVNDRVNQS